MTQPHPVARIDSVTDLAAAPAALDTAADMAVQAADAAARSAGVRVREMSTLADLDAVFRLYIEIWRPDPKDPPVTTDLLRALTKAGNYASGAFLDGELVGACMAFFGPPKDASMHSHIAGVSGAARGRSVGYALKLHQRAWAMLRGVGEIAWTFDPLIRRNAYFNLVKLAAGAQEYLPNFYGDMHDGINSGDDSDRLLVRWRLADPDVVTACLGGRTSADASALRAAGAAVALQPSDSGRPTAGAAGTRTVLVGIPDDIERIRAYAAWSVPKR